MTSYFLSAKIMFRLLVVLFVITLYTRTDTFKLIKKKHGQGVLTVMGKLENFENKDYQIRKIHQIYKNV